MNKEKILEELKKKYLKENKGCYEFLETAVPGNNHSMLELFEVTSEFIKWATQDEVVTIVNNGKDNGETVYKREEDSFIPIGRTNVDWLTEGVWYIRQEPGSKRTTNLNYRIDKLELPENEEVNFKNLTELLNLEDEICSAIINLPTPHSLMDEIEETVKLIYKKLL